MQTKINQNPLLWLLLLLTAWTCLAAPDWEQKTASGQNSWLESASGEMTGREAAPRLGFGGLAENWASGALVATKSVGTLGREGEAAVRGAYDLGDKAKIFVNGNTRIPDGINRAANTLSEVKNVDRLSLTSQLRDYSTYARDEGLQFNLYTRPNTTLSGPLKDAIDTGLINHFHIP